MLNNGAHMCKMTKMTATRLLINVIFCCDVITSSISTASVTYKKQTDSNGRAVCSSDSPVHTIQMTSGKMLLRCGTECAHFPCCRFYQFKADTALCELFHEYPRNFGNIVQCTSFEQHKPCPCGWISIESSCYKLITDRFLNWTDANSYCNSLHSNRPHLMIVENSQKQTIVEQLLNMTQVRSKIHPIVKENIALLQPTWQISTYGSCISSGGVDGSYQTNWYVAPGCAQTNYNAAGQWWAVDLGNVTFVNSVQYSIRSDSNAQRSNNFIIGLTNNPPVTVSPLTNGYDRCGQYPGAVIAGKNTTLLCNSSTPSGRYLVLIGHSIDGYLEICEMEVHGEAYVWLAGQLSNSTSQFVWKAPTGGGVSMMHANWGSGYPNDTAANGCLAIHAEQGFWRNIPCNTAAHVYTICEM